MKKILFFLLVSASAFAQPKVPYGTTGDITAESDMWLKYNFASRSYDVYFKDVSDTTSPASDSVLVAGTVRFKKLLPSSTLLTSISATAPISYNSTTGIIGLNYDSLHASTDTRYYRRLSSGLNILSGDYRIGGNPILRRIGGYTYFMNIDSTNAIITSSAGFGRENQYQANKHSFIGPDIDVYMTSAGLEIGPGGGNSVLGYDGRAYFGYRTSIGKAPTSNMLEVGGDVNFDGDFQLNRRIDIDGGDIGGVAANESLVNFKNHDGSNMGRVGDFNMTDLYVDLMGIKGTGLSVGAYGSEERVLAIDTLQQVKIVSGKTGIAQALTIQNDSTLATTGRGSELKFTATGDTTLASIQVVTQTTNNKVGLMKFLTNNGTANGVRLTIDQNGNVGIADETPSYKLDITGDLRTTSSAYFATSGTGGVGIGTTSPLGTLHLVSSVADPFFIEQTSATGYAQTIYKGTAQRFQVGVGGASEVGVGVPNKFFVYDGTAGFVRMVIDQGGRVGIGTTSPATGALLDLTSTTQLFAPPRMTTTQAGAIGTKPTGGMYYDTTLNKMRFWNGSAYETITSAP